jgi:hypothetical protein
MKTLLAILAGLSITLASCVQSEPKKNVDEGKIEGDVYTSEEIGWTIEIPKGWTVVANEETRQTNQRGLKALENAIEMEMDYSGLKNLISFQKNQFNIFQSTSQPFELEYEGEWEDNDAALKELIYLTYEKQGIIADSTATKIEAIDGFDFRTYSFTIFSSKGEIILRQIMFSRLINGFDFGVNINYNNDKDRDELLKVLRNSKFKKK